MEPFRIISLKKTIYFLILQLSPKALFRSILFGLLLYIPLFLMSSHALTDMQSPALNQGGSGMSGGPLTLSEKLYSVHPSSNLYKIHLKSRQFIPETSDVIIGQRLRQLKQRDQERIHLLVQLNAIPNPAARAKLEKEGLKLLSYIPHYTWIASIPAGTPAAALDHPSVTWAGELRTDDKLDPAITKNQWGSWHLSIEGTAAVCVAMQKDESLSLGRELVTAYNGRVTGEITGIRVLMAEIPKDNIPRLAGEDAVLWIEPAPPPLGPASDGARAQINVDALQETPYSLDGTYVDVLVYDSGQAGDHTDFGSRLIHGDSDTVTLHSTMVAGVIGGDGSASSAMGGTDEQWRGMAPNTDLISYGTAYSGSGVIFYENVPDIETDFAAAQNTYGADVACIALSSNIYSNYPSQCDLMGNYGASAVLLDQIVAGRNTKVGDGDKYITVGSVGNECGYGTSCGTYGTISPPAAAKNPIHVGGAYTCNNNFYEHTSRGPTDDGRIKPLVNAGACQSNGDLGITSTDDSPANSYTTICGTSMAAASVTGGIALMLEQYRKVYNTLGRFWPSTAKALLIQTAVDSGSIGPDYRWGYGLVDIQSAVDLISQNAFVENSIGDSEVHTYYFSKTNDTDPFTVSLAWDDPESTFNAKKTLVNDLDLWAISPDGTVWRPWILNAAYPSNDATRGYDSVNNQEQVRVYSSDTELRGLWKIRIEGSKVPSGPQDYSLVCDDNFSDKPPTNPALYLLLLSSSG